MRQHDSICSRLTAPIDAARIRLASIRQQVRILAKSVSDTERKAFAATFIYEAIATLAGELDQRYVMRDGLDKKHLIKEHQELAQNLGREASRLPIEESGYALTSLYTSMLSAKERADLGAFYTPYALCNQLMDMAEDNGVNWANARVLDPSSGGGAFLLAVSVKIMNALKDEKPAKIIEHIGSNLVGFEIDPSSAYFSQTLLDLLFRDLSRSSGLALPSIVHVCDTLEKIPAPEFDLVIGNPPYGRITLTPEQRSRFHKSLYGHANLYGVFTDIALRWAKPNGMIAYLTPTSVLSGQYYSSLRNLLATEAPPVAINFVHARHGVFEDVLQETVLTLFQASKYRETFRVNYIAVKNDREANLTKNGSGQLPNDPSEPWMLPRSPAHVPLISLCKTMPTRFSDWGYEISTGPLVWNRHKSQLRKRLGEKTFPLIWAESIQLDGRFVFKAEKRNHAPYIKLDGQSDHLVTNESCVLLQRTTSKEQVRRLIAAEIPENFIAHHGGAVIENHVNILRPKGDVLISPKAVAAILNSNIVDEIFRCISGSVAVSAYELRSLPLPPIDSMKRIENLVTRGARPEIIEAELREIYWGDSS